MSGEQRFFADPAAWRAWLEEHHATETEVVVGFYKKGSGRPSITWPESVDQALCFGWIDAIRRGIDDVSYEIRFTRRKPGSNWSAINVAKVAELEAAGLMTPAGRKAYEGRTAAKSGIYSYEQRGSAALEPEQEALFRANAAAWADWEARPPGYRKDATWWVVTAKRPETRERRLGVLIAACAAGELIPTKIPTKKK